MCEGEDVIANLTLEGERVRLEPVAERHLADLLARCADPALWEFTFSVNPFTGEDGARAWLGDIAALPDHHAFAIVERATGHAIGSTRFADIQPAHRKLEIGWTFLQRASWRSGINTECKYLLLRYAFEQWNAERVQLKAEATNERSRQAILGIGAAYEGTLRSYRIHPKSGDARDTSFYSVIAREWPAVRERLERRLAGA
jgi:RimJ/RimL family protein N-acetyltransferase